MDFSLLLPDPTLYAALAAAMDAKTKPPGSLGRLEALALQVGLVQQRLDPVLVRPHLVIFAADHGAAAAGLSAYPPDVTWQMVENFLAGGAAANVLARRAGLGLLVVDAGVKHDFAPRTGLVDAKLGLGTASYLDGAAMTLAQCEAALERGAALVAALAREGCNVVCLGEMGIGNTASASLLTHCLTGAPLAACVGRGTGLDDAGLARKRRLLAEAAVGFDAQQAAPLEVLARFGGFEIAMLCGAMIAAAQARMVVVIDGFIVTAALLVAARLAPALPAYCVAAHRSGEAAHVLQLRHLGLEPLLDLGLRLGEGSGAALAYPMLEAACALLNEMASFASAGVAARC